MAALNFNTLYSLFLYLTIPPIHTVNSIGLSVGSECVAFDTISSHPDVSDQPHDIGWIKVMSCTESSYANTSNIFHYHRSDYLSLAPTTISIKLQPPGGKTNPNYNDLTVIAKPYSNPIQYGVRNGKEVSYQYDSSGNAIDFADLSNWIGSATALARLSQVPSNCLGIYGDKLHERVYHACGSWGIHVFPNRDQSYNYLCAWNYGGLTGEDIEVHFGFALNDSICDTDQDRTTASPSKGPYSIPTLRPTVLTPSPTLLIHMNVNDHSRHTPETTLENASGFYDDARDTNGSNNESTQEVGYNLISISIGVAVFICLGIIIILVIYKYCKTGKRANEVEMNVDDDWISSQEPQNDDIFMEAYTIEDLQRKQRESQIGMETNEEGAVFALPETTNGMIEPKDVDANVNNDSITKRITTEHENDYGDV